MSDTTKPETVEPVELSDEEWRAKLSPERYAVLRQKGTEPAWSGELLHVEGSGMFTCAGCGADLFESDTKFESGSGWPSFYR
ncbi:MAG TPA: peptide-methionine (R)-S-oxide reductase, partial [Acidimicrobiales bacterium]